jgi:hypothetical protein
MRLLLFWFILSSVAFGASVDKTSIKWATGDSTTVSTGDAGSTAQIFFYDDGAEESLRFKDPDVPAGRDFSDLIDVSWAGLHAQFTDDDHLQYYNETRLDAYLADSANGNLIGISGDVGGQTTLGGHVADDSVHWPRPGQSLWVGEGGSGEFVTFAAAAASANAGASSSTPYEIVLYPGVYASATVAGGTTLEQYVGIRAALPGTVKMITDVGSTTHQLKLKGSNWISGITFVPAHDVPCLAIISDPTATNPILVEDCVFQGFGSIGANINDETASSSGKILFRNCQFLGPFVADRNNDTTGFVPGDYSWRFESCQFLVTSEIGTAIDCAESNGMEFSASVLYNEGLSGNPTDSFSFNDSQANTEMRIEYCRFIGKGHTGFGHTLLDLPGTELTAFVHGCVFEWVNALGTQKPFFVGNGSTISVSSTVYDAGEYPGPGQVTPRSEGDAAFGSMEMTGSLTIDGSEPPVAGFISWLLTLEPGADDDQEGFRVVPRTAMDAAGTWRAGLMDLSALDPATTGAIIRGLQIDAQTVDLTNSPEIAGLVIDMPASYTAGRLAAAEMSGDGDSLKLLTDVTTIEILGTHGGILISPSGDQTHNVIEIEPATQITDDFIDYNFIRLDGGNLDPVGVSDIVQGIDVDFRLLESISGNSIYGIRTRLDATYANSDIAIWAEGDGREVQICNDTAAIEIDGLVDMSAALSALKALIIGTKGEIWDDGLGLFIDGSVGDPLFAGLSITLKLGDNAGAEELRLWDSDEFLVFSVDSDGNLSIAGGADFTDLEVSKLGVGRVPNANIPLDVLGTNNPTARITRGNGSANPSTGSGALNVLARSTFGDGAHIEAETSTAAALTVNNSANSEKAVFGDTRAGTFTGNADPVVAITRGIGTTPVGPTCALGVHAQHNNGSGIAAETANTGTGRFGGIFSSTVSAYNCKIGSVDRALEIEGPLVNKTGSIVDVTASGGITPNRSKLLIQGSGGPVTITANPQIASGLANQRLILHGQSDTNTVTIRDGDGVKLPGFNAITLGQDDYITLDYSNARSIWVLADAAPLKTDVNSWFFRSLVGSPGTFYTGGFYDFFVGDDDFDPTAVNFGTANAARGAHFFVVLGATTVDELTITVTGTSIIDDGTRTASDTEAIVIPNSTAVDSYFETTKKWLGEVSIDVTGGTPKTCNYGFTKYWDSNNRDFKIIGIEWTWLAGANDTGAEFEVFHHKATGWTFNTGAAPTPPTPLTKMTDDYVTERNLVNGENGTHKRDDLDTFVNGNDGEGLIGCFTVTSGSAVDYGTFEATIQLD